MITLEFYFRTLTVLFWITLLFNWVFIPNPIINYYVFNTYFVLSIIYITLAIINKIKHKSTEIRDKVDFYYKLISIITFVISMMYFLLYSNSIKLLLIKTFIIFLYFYISFKKVNLKDEEGVVGIIGSILIFVFATYY